DHGRPREGEYCRHQLLVPRSGPRGSRRADRGGAHPGRFRFHRRATKVARNLVVDDPYVSLPDASLGHLRKQLHRPDGAVASGCDIAALTALRPLRITLLTALS